MLIKYSSNALVFLLATTLMTGPVLADPPRSGPKGPPPKAAPFTPRIHPGVPLYAGPHSPYVRPLPPERYRLYRGVRIYRPYGLIYPGFGFYYTDNDAFFWLAFTAFTLIILHELSEQQQRTHENAIVMATRAPIGETVTWRDGNASGWVTATREGTSTLGRYCREFQQTVTVGGKTETAYGTACRQEDGQWEIISTRNE
ncbi:RT0821/Lpp0805 family surface protein [Emcibacter sp.]|uniref:RT0821/Lpp0805 family surface protein n=1 Tax=Emcibacter sp. TaxID=1979954 RepID=UPI003A8E12A9